MVYKSLEEKREYETYYRAIPKNKERKKLYRLVNKEILAEKRREKYQELKMKVYNHYSNYNIKCNCCGERYIEFLSIDHVNNDGKQQKHLRGITQFNWIIKNRFPSSFQILCMNCNFARGHDKEYLCRHQKELIKTVGLLT